MCGSVRLYKRILEKGKNIYNVQVRTVDKFHYLYDYNMLLFFAGLKMSGFLRRIK